MIRPIQFGDIATLQEWITAPLTEAMRLSKSTWPTASAASLAQRASTMPMPVDVYSDHDQAVIIAALPGVHPDDLDVSVHRNTATIRAVVRDGHTPTKGDGVTWYISELGRGTFERSVSFPFAIDEQGVEAQFANGLLRLVLPRREQDRPQRIPVKVGGFQTPFSLEAAAGGAADGNTTAEVMTETVAD